VSLVDGSEIKLLKGIERLIGKTLERRPVENWQPPRHVEAEPARPPRPPQRSRQPAAPARRPSQNRPSRHRTERTERVFSAS